MNGKGTQGSRSLKRLGATYGPFSGSHPTWLEEHYEALQDAAFQKKWKGLPCGRQ